MNDLQDRLQEVFREVFDDEEITINPHTSATDIENWDSLMHVTLIVNVEKAFAVRFTSAEVANLKDVGELLALMVEKKANS
jgi:acyl carrier protein